MTALSSRKPGEIFVDRGSIYNPGWHIVEQVRDDHQRVLHSFDTEADAVEDLPYYQE